MKTLFLALFLTILFLSGCNNSPTSPTSSGNSDSETLIVVQEIDGEYTEVEYPNYISHYCAEKILRVQTQDSTSMIKLESVWGFYPKEQE